MMKRTTALVTTFMHSRPFRRLRRSDKDDFSVYRPAGFVQRWYALTLDLALSGPLDMLINLPFSRRLEKLAAYGHSGRYWVLSAFLLLVPVLLYFAGCRSRQS